MAFERLEPCAVKIACTVLRGLGGGNAILATRCSATPLRRKRRQPVKSNGLAAVESKFCDGIAIGADPNFCSLPELTPISLAVAIGFQACTTF
jgi:hypothetical protein